MRNFLLSLLIFLIWAFIGMWWYYSCTWCNGHTSTKTIQEETNIRPEKNDTDSLIKSNKSGIQILDEKGESIINLSEGIRIFKHSDSIDIPTSSLTIKDSIFKYLNTHQNQELQIVGWYNEAESKTNIDSLNLGLNRANYIKDLLSKFGVNPDKIYATGAKNTFNYSSNNDYLGGIELFFKKISEDHLSKIDKGITNKTLYSHFNQRAFKPDNTLQAYAFELKNYLNNHPNKKVMIIGHSDNVGDEKTNEIVARDRATNVLKYLASTGINKEKLSASSKGELEPIATNNTKEGRALNRRIEIKVN
ncbi:OmpA family protein [Pseudofulvibacter geojedonensis]|uniref:OmpA family protein n=1 Tax=Pseudofulvibacter geojedonensis TaxID=1123758 RepID=A0ABW3I3F2_9FLAO